MKTDAGAGATAINPRRFQTRDRLYVSFVCESRAIKEILHDGGPDSIEAKRRACGGVCLRERDYCGTP